MKPFNILIIAVVAILSVAAGLAKVMEAPQEMEFLQGAGLSPTLILAFGLVQILGGALLATKRTRTMGAYLAVAGFAASTLLILMGGDLVFGLISAIPIALSALVAYQAARTPVE
jgi:hypothetical protein